MKKEKLLVDKKAEIEVVELIYENFMIFTNKAACGVEVEEFEIPDKEGYATVNGIDRRRFERAYRRPVQSR